MKTLILSLAMLIMLACRKDATVAPMFRSVTISVNPNGITPLAASVNLIADQPVNLSYIVKGQNGEDYNGSGNVLQALYPDYRNEVVLTITNHQGQRRDTIIFVQTGKLPTEALAQSNIILNQSASRMGTQFIVLFPNRTGDPSINATNSQYPTIIDKYGRIRGFINIPFVGDIIQMDNGHYLLNDHTYFQEIDMIGTIYNKIPAFCHHDFVFLANGNLLYTGEDKSVNNTIEDKLYEITYPGGVLVNVINLYNLFDPTRRQLPLGPANDWLHNNSLIYSKDDNSIIITGRNQSLTAKIDLNTQKVKWIISDSTYWKGDLKSLLLKPIGNFEHSYGQHSVQVNPVDKNKIMIFDDGNSRSYTSPLSYNQSYSRMVEYQIDEKAKTVIQTYQFGKEYGAANYAMAMGNVNYITPTDRFVCFPNQLKDIQGNPSPTGVAQIRLMETIETDVVLDISIKNTDATKAGYITYRGHPFSF